MNRSNVKTLIGVGLASLVLGGVISYCIFLAKSVSILECPTLGPDEKANYVLHFGTCDSTGQCSRVSVVSISAFTAALQSGPISSFTTLNKRETNDPTQGLPIGGLLTVSTPVIPKAVINLSQCKNGSPCNMHVTQKAGLNSPDQVQAVLATLRPDN